MIHRDRLRTELKKVNMSYKGKLNLLGCTPSQFQRYVEQQFEDWMNWNNQGGRDPHIRTWELDHIKAAAQHDLTNEDDLERMNHWSNFQPLEWQDNARKSSEEVDGFEWSLEEGRYMWSATSGRNNYNLPPVDDDDMDAEELEEFERCLDECDCDDDDDNDDDNGF